MPDENMKNIGEHNWFLFLASNPCTGKTQHKSRTHVFKILTTTNTICGENCESSCVQV